MGTGVLLVSLLGACAGRSSYMKVVPDEAVSLAPGPGQATIVFMRPSGFGFAIQSTVFDVKGDENAFIGVVSAKKKVVFKTAPGEHLFMAVGESADFMKADLAPGKVYYALVTPRMGAWKARFSLRPVSAAELDSDEFKGWVEGCTYTENTEASLDWARNNAAGIQSKKVGYLQKWNEKAPEDRPFLRPEDGR